MSQPSHDNIKLRDESARRRLVAVFRSAARRAAARIGNDGSVGSFHVPRRLRRLRTTDTTIFGVATTLLVVMATMAGMLNTPEEWFYDLRTRFCQWGRPSPTKQLVHLDMDDAAIAAIGRWPWSRSEQAEILNELALAAPKAVALDIIYNEREQPTWVEDSQGRPVAKVDHDAQFAAAIRRLGCTVLGYSHENQQLREKHSPAFLQAVELLKSNPGIQSSTDLLAYLPDLKPAQQAELTRQFASARVQAIREIVAQHLSEGVASRNELFSRFRAALPATQPADDSYRDQTRRVVERAYDMEASLLAMRKSQPVQTPDDLNPSTGRKITGLYSEPVSFVSLPEFTEAAKATAFFTYIKDGDGLMRHVPLLINERGRVSVSLGLGLALQTLGLSPDTVHVTRSTVILGSDANAIKIPVRDLYFPSTSTQVAGVFDIPWFGKAGPYAWQEMYDREQSVSVAEIWKVVDLRRRIRENNRQLREACLTLQGAILGGQPDEAQTALEQRPPNLDDPNAWAAVAAALLSDRKEDVEALIKSPPPDPGSPPTDPTALTEWRNKNYESLFYRAAISIPKCVDELYKIQADIVAQRQKLAGLFGGKSILIGWTATGQTDFVATPLHASCPGVRVHGAVFNAIMTRNFLTFAPMWVTFLLTGVFGLLSTLAVVRYSPGFAQVLALACALVYTGINCYLFGYHGYVMGLAAPLAAIALTWATGSVVRYIIERAERTRILKRFSTYVDPQLVNYVLEHPDKDVMAGDKRDITVCFTDLAGFTSLSEAMGEQTVGLLNDYFSVMIPIIRKHRGYLNKLLGDGMMFFFNAPLPNASHTANAFDAVLEMQHVLTGFNRGLEEKGLPTVKMRVGITRGVMIAGDAGGEAAGYSDYTVLGDVVNLASRLEGANKASGTLILCNQDARDASHPTFLTRPVGILRVVGKKEGIETFEVMCRREDASPEQLEVVRLSELMISAFRCGNFDDCCQHAQELIARSDKSKIPSLYLDLCRDLRAQGVPAGFDGTIVLDSK